MKKYEVYELQQLDCEWRSKVATIWYFSSEEKEALWII